MPESERIVQLLSPGPLGFDESLSRAADVDRNYRAEVINMQLVFGSEPTATALAQRLYRLDLETRRTAANLRNPGGRVDPGAPPLPSSLGLRVRGTYQGSLVVDLAAAAYAAATSQPLSFVLNVASLAGYSRLALTSGLSGERVRAFVRLRGRGPLPVDHEDLEPPEISRTDTAPVEFKDHEGREISLRGDFTKLEIEIKSQDGDTLRVNCER